MSNNHNRYLAIFQALTQFLPTPPQGNQRRHLCVLAALITGILGSRHTNLPQIASAMPGGVQRESRIKRAARWLQNPRIDKETYFLPFAAALLASLPEGPMALVMDGSEVGRGCLALVVSVLYQKRALPLAWIVVKGKKGHFPQDTHIALLEDVAPLVPAGRNVLFLGDGEFDGGGLLAAVVQRGWQFACRTAKNVLLQEEGVDFGFDDLAVAPGELLSIPDVAFTAQGWGPVTVVAHWRRDCAEPLFLVTNLDLADEAVYWYRKRFGIETLFSDIKSRGFFLHRCHLREPARLSRLLIAVCLAYLWIVHLGATVASRVSLLRQVHRRDRRDLSLFTLGLAWLAECQEQGKLPEATFLMPKAKSVRW